ncbi:hypothetical protein AYI70_g11662 [Smittium culicis]|uniref:Secreted protein n=1 Tax=Smittium culicis TaxID=133412 RepID=A0A1R1X0Z2_9FUNG|nr:hypothetical protein AYI70_g11662 [Smittium culicis]
MLLQFPTLLLAISLHCKSFPAHHTSSKYPANHLRFLSINYQYPVLHSSPRHTLLATTTATSRLFMPNRPRKFPRPAMRTAI